MVILPVLTEVFTERILALWNPSDMTRENIRRNSGSEARKLSFVLLFLLMYNAPF